MIDWLIKYMYGANYNILIIVTSEASNMPHQGLFLS